MKRAAFLITVLCTTVAMGAYAADLLQVRNVYLLHMGNGLDQYLANHLTGMGVVNVVTDPEKADAILTDEIGERFEQRLEELYPPPPPEEPEADSEAADDAEAKDEVDEELFKMSERPRLSSFGRGRGNVFLVDRASRRVVWSMFHRPKETTPKAMNKAAEVIVTNLKTALGGL